MQKNYIIDDNLSYAWARALELILTPGVSEIPLLVVSVKNIKNNIPAEDPEIREALDYALAKHNKYQCNTVANTIFPKQLWNPDKEAQCLYDRYLNIISEVRGLDIVSKRFGLYFDRLINFGGTSEKKGQNQLKYILETRNEKNNKRRSSYQASIIDPLKDHTNSGRKGFPCLQQVSFSHPLGSNKLSVTGFYPQQYLFDRAYGNYLGLCWLGHFMAHELGMEFTEMNCIAVIGSRGNIKKTDPDIQKINQLFINKRKENNEKTEGEKK